MRAARSLCLLSAVLLAVGCSDSPTEPGSQALSADELEVGAGKVAVVTRNLYVGTDVDAVIAALAGAGDPQTALIQAIQTLAQTNFPARLPQSRTRSLGRVPTRSGCRKSPRSTWYCRHSGWTSTRTSCPRCWPSCASAACRNTGWPPRSRTSKRHHSPGVSLVDYDALLVDTRRVKVGATSAQNFSANLGNVAPGVVLKRGWVSAAVTIRAGQSSPSRALISSPAMPPA